MHCTWGKGILWRWRKLNRESQVMCSQWTYKIYLQFSFIVHGMTNSWNTFLWKTWTLLYQLVNDIAADGLATGGTGVLTAMIFTDVSKEINMPVFCFLIRYIDLAFNLLNPINAYFVVHAHIFTNLGTICWKLSCVHCLMKWNEMKSCTLWYDYDTDTYGILGASFTCYNMYPAWDINHTVTELHRNFYFNMSLEQCFVCPQWESSWFE